MASFNKVILVGNLTRDPQVRYTPSGMAVSDISLAINNSWFDKSTNQRREEVTFVEVTLWGRTAEIAGEYLAKGKQVLIEGRLQLDQWDDKETGQKRNKLKVVCEDMRMLGSRQEGAGAGAGGGGGRGPANAPSQQNDSSGSFDNQESHEPAGNYEPEIAPPTGDVPF